MNRISILLGLTMTICFLSPVSATTEFGLVGQSGWSDNFYLDNPNGWGLYASKSLSRKVSIRFTYSRLGKEFRYIGLMQFGLLFPGVDTTREFIRSDVSANFYEFSIHHTLVEGSKMRLEAGAGIGSADFDLHLRGESTGKTISTGGYVDSPTILSLSVEVIVKEFIRSPLALRIGYKYRTMSTMSQILDGFNPISDLSMSSVNVAIVSRL